MARLVRVIGTLLVVAGLAGLALLAAGGPESSSVAEPVGGVAQPDLEAVGARPPASAASGSPSAVSPVAGSNAAVPVPRVVFEDDFVDNRMHWPDNTGSTAWLDQPGYRLVPREPGHFVAVSVPFVRPLADVVLTGTFHKRGGPPGGGYGLILRDQRAAEDGLAQDGRYYVLEVGDRGDVGIWRRENDHWVDLVAWTPSDAVRQGSAPNTLEAWAIGQRLTLVVNGVEVASAVDPALSAGSVGVFTGGDGNDVLLDRVAVRVPDDGTSPSFAADDRSTAPQADEPATSTTPPPPQASIPAPTPTPVPFRPITRVVIPSIALDAPSKPAELIRRGDAITWEVPPFTAGHAQGTAGAGDSGNAVVVGHVTSRSVGNVFEHLHEVSVGDAVDAFSGQERFGYRVVSVRNVPRGDISVVEKTDAPSLTLITCTGVWLPLVNDYAERLVVRAELAE